MDKNGPNHQPDGVNIGEPMILGESHSLLRPLKHQPYQPCADVQRGGSSESELGYCL